MGCYPLFACANWSHLAEDIARLENDLISVTIVTDPFGAWSEDLLRAAFPDFCVRYKEHYVVDLDTVSLQGLPSHHRRNIRRGMRDVTAEFCARPEDHLGDWRHLYSILTRRHNISGIAAFSDRSLREQLSVPGLHMQRAVHAGETVGMILWYMSRGVVYYHLGAYSERGYALRASYALFWHALEHFRGRARWAELGAAAGARPGDGNGLDRFKAGWASGMRPVFLCGRILSPGRYAELNSARGTESANYFPAYRTGEFR